MRKNFFCFFFFSSLTLLLSNCSNNSCQGVIGHWESPDESLKIDISQSSGNYILSIDKSSQHLNLMGECKDGRLIVKTDKGDEVLSEPGGVTKDAGNMYATSYFMGTEIRLYEMKNGVWIDNKK